MIPRPFFDAKDYFKRDDVIMEQHPSKRTRPASSANATDFSGETLPHRLPHHPELPSLLTR